MTNLRKPLSIFFFHLWRLDHSRVSRLLSTKDLVIVSNTRFYCLVFYVKVKNFIVIDTLLKELKCQRIPYDFSQVIESDVNWHPIKGKEFVCSFQG